jgi:hypothetical protein
VTLPRKPARYWGDGDFNALADAIEGVSDSMPITYNQDDAPVPPIPANSVWIDTNDGGRAYVWSGTDWVSLEGPAGPQGPDGLDGIDGDDGLPGPAGTSSYTHIAYANEDVTPWSGFSTSDATNKLYIGMLVNDVQADPGIEDAGLYRWTLIKGLDGEDGIPGAAGADGQTPYFHVAYATAADGSTGFSTTDATGKTHIGTYTDYTEADSSNPALYTWALFKGADGSNGSNGTNGARGPGNYSYQSSVSSQATAEPFFATQALAVIPNPLVFQDRFTYFNPAGSPPWTISRFWDGSAWVDLTQYIDGNLLVSGTVAASKFAGNIIRTANYAYSGTEGGASEVATAGAKMQSASGGLALLAAVDGVKFGATKFSDLWSWGHRRRSDLASAYSASNAWVALSDMLGGSDGGSFVRGCVTTGSVVDSLKVTQAGNYMVSWRAEIAASAVAHYKAAVYKVGGAQVGYFAETTLPSSGDYYYLSDQFFAQLSANDDLQFKVYIEAGKTFYVRNYVITITRLPD